jgi:hypothetical protein
MQRTLPLLLAALSLAFAPLPKPGLSSGQEELLRSAEADMRAGSAVMAALFDRGPAAVTKEMAAEARRQMSAHFRKAAPKLGRLAADLARAGAAEAIRAEVEYKAGAAWQGAGGDQEAALAHFTEAARLATDPNLRASALDALAAAHLSLGKPKETARCLKLLRAELPRLGAGRRKELEERIVQLERFCP